MRISNQLDRWHAWARSNRWLRYFTWLNRCLLALGFIPAGFVKVTGERFTNLSGAHPMGHFLEAFYYTEFYYTFVGVLQMLAGSLLLIPRTASLGAVIYFPIILNICVLSLAVRFEGSLISSPLMVLSNLYLLCWDYHKWKYLLPWDRRAADVLLVTPAVRDKRFPFAFFGGVIATMAVTIFIVEHAFAIYPRNSTKDCSSQCDTNAKPEACLAFCDCVHRDGRLYAECLALYRAAPEVSKN